MENKVETVENTEKKKEPMTTKQKVFLGLRIAFNVVFYALIIFLFIFSIMNIRGGNGTENFPNIFGKGFLNVQSNSMKRDENKIIYPEWNNYSIKGFSEGDLINVDVVDQNSVNNLKVGDVITFRWKIGSTKILNTHRIVYVHKDANGKVDYVDTQGDMVAQEKKYNENWSEAEKLTNIAYYNSNNLGLERTVAEHVDASMVLGRVTGVNSGAGKVLDTIQKNWLFIFVIPIIVLLVIEIFLVIRNIMLLRGEKNKLELADTKEAMLAEVEAEKEKMRQELLAELRAQGLAPAEDLKPADEPKPEEPQVEEAAPVEAAVVTTSEEKVEEPQEEVKEEITKVEETSEEAPIEEAKEEEPTQAEEVSTEEVKESEVAEETQEAGDQATALEEDKVETEEVEPEVLEPATKEVKEENVEEKKETPKKASPKKSSTTAKKSTSTTKKTTGTTKKSTKKTEE